MKPPILLLVGLVAALLLVGGRSHDVQPAIVYKTRGPSALMLDLYRPLPLGPRRPVLVVVHGGSWMYGDRSQFARYCRAFTRQGFAVACIDYSLAPRLPWTDAVDDVADAVRFLRVAAPSLGLDPDRVALLGISAGAHLAVWACLSGELQGVRALVDLYGPMDLTTPDFSVDYTVRDVFGGTDAARRRASPAFHLDRPLPPLLIVHGDSDPIVPLAQSTAFDARLRVLGNRSELLVVHNAGHDLVPVDGPIDPPLHLIVERISAFLRHMLM